MCGSKKKIYDKIFGVDDKRKNKRPKGLIYKKHKENPTSFKKGLIPWNKGKPGYHTSRKSMGYYNLRGYLVFCIKGKEFLAHRMIWKKYYGAIPEGYVIHHEDGNILNNDISNLKLVTRAEHSIIHDFVSKMLKNREVKKK